jgi:hypothetical protein
MSGGSSSTSRRRKWLVAQPEAYSGLGRRYSGPALRARWPGCKGMHGTEAGAVPGRWLRIGQLATFKRDAWPEQRATNAAESGDGTGGVFSTCFPAVSYQIV